MAVNTRISSAVSSCLTPAEQDPLIGALARSNPGPNLDANQVVLAQRAASTSSSVGLGLFDGKPTRRRASAEERKRRGRTERVRHQRASERDTRHVDMSHAELTRVADQNPGHDRTVTNSYPSLRNIPYQLCETPLVQLARRCQRWRRVSVRGSPNEAVPNHVIAQPLWVGWSTAVPRGPTDVVTGMCLRPRMSGRCGTPCCAPSLAGGPGPARKA